MGSNAFGQPLLRKEDARLLTETHDPCADGGAYQNQIDLAHYPRTFLISGLAHQGVGSIGAPSFLNST